MSQRTDGVPVVDVVRVRALVQQLCNLAPYWSDNAAAKLVKADIDAALGVPPSDGGQ